MSTFSRLFAASFLFFSFLCQASQYVVSGYGEVTDLDDQMLSRFSAQVCIPLQNIGANVVLRDASNLGLLNLEYNASVREVCIPVITNQYGQFFIPQFFVVSEGSSSTCENPVPYRRNFIQPRVVSNGLVRPNYQLIQLRTPTLYPFTRSWQSVGAFVTPGENFYRYRPPVQYVDRDIRTYVHSLENRRQLVCTSQITGDTYFESMGYIQMNLHIRVPVIH